MLLLITGITVAACGGGSGGDSVAGRDPAPATGTTATTATSTTTTRPAPTTTTTTPPYSFDGSVPPPEIVDTGDDYEAIAESMLAYIAWLKRHNPDPELLSNVYVDGTDLMKRGRRDLAQLAEHNYRIYDVDQQIEVEAVTVDRDLVTCLAHERLNAVQLIDSSGRVLDEMPAGPQNEDVVVLVRGPAGGWRISAISASTRGAEVRL